MLFIVFVFFYLWSDHAPWWVISLAILAVAWDWVKERQEDLGD